MPTARTWIGLVIAATSLVCVGAPPAAAQDSLCQGADKLAGMNATAEARKAYADLLLQHPNLECAREGLDAIVNPEPPDPVKEAENLCARGDVYAERGLEEDAKKAYDQALAKNVDAECAQDGLDPPWYKRAADFVGDVAPDVLLLLGAALVIGLLLLMLGYIPFVAAGFSRVPLVRVWLRPRLALADLDDSSLGDSKVGTAMTARIRERLQRFREEGLEEDDEGYYLDTGGSDQPLVDIVAGDDQLKSTIAKLGEVSEHTKIVAAVIDAAITALPIKRLALAGVLEPAQKRVPAATLVLTEGPRLAGTVGLDTPALPADPVSADYLQLCDAAAVWVQYEVARQLRGGAVDRDAATSYALVRAGLDLVRADRIPEAIEAFSRAIAAQPDNWSAHVNLITVLMRFVDSPDMARRIKRVLVRMRRIEDPW
jgi:tetratricopeptide (TPR) repeat protein